MAIAICLLAVVIRTFEQFQSRFEPLEAAAWAYTPAGRHADPVGEKYHLPLMITSYPEQTARPYRAGPGLFIL